MNPNINLVSKLMEIDGRFKIKGTKKNYDHDGGFQFIVKFKGTEQHDNVDIFLNKKQIRLISKCNNLKEIYECYSDIYAYYVEMKIFDKINV